MDLKRVNKIFVFGGLLILLGISSSQGDRQVVDMDFGWKFLKGEAMVAQAVDFDDSGWRDIQVPHDWSIEGPYSIDYASGTGFLPGGVGWYRKTFTLDESLRGKKIFIEFDGVYNNSDVWINAKHLGGRPFGYISFQYDMTPYVKFGGENVLAVRVDHSQFADSRWYTGSGIYRHVRMTITDPLYIKHWGTCITTPVIEKDTAQVKIQTDIKNEGDKKSSFTLVSEILDAAGNAITKAKSEHTLKARKSDSILQTVNIPNPQLWSPDSPILYKVKSQVLYDNSVVDETTTPLGIRSFRFDSDKGFFLNGKKMKLKGMCLHHDAGPVGAAVPEKMWLRRLEAMKKIGCNAIRCSHNPPAPEFLDLCDKMGFLVQDEAFDEFTPTKRKWVKGWNKGTPSRDGYGDVFEEWAVQDIQDMVRRDRNHPSIIMWSIGNEIDYRNDPFSHPSLGDGYDPNNPPAENLTKYANKLVAAVKALDKSRPVTAALATAPMSNAVGFSDILDIVGYNYQEKFYEDHHAQYPDRVLYGSENGRDLKAWLAVEENDFISGQFVWTGIDYLGEAGAWPYKSWTRSLFDLCGFQKPVGWFRESIWTDEAMVYIAVQPEGKDSKTIWGWPDVRPHWNWDKDSIVEVHCYTNCEEVELVLNGKSLGTKLYSDASDRILRWNAPYETGTLKAIGKSDGKEVCQSILQTAGQAQKIKLTTDNTILKADGKDIAHLTFEVTDENGIRVPNAEDQIIFEVTGPGKIIALGNANPISHESHQGNQRKVWHGRGLAVIRADKTKGAVTIKATGSNLETASVSIQVK